MTQEEISISGLYEKIGELESIYNQEGFSKKYILAVSECKNLFQFAQRHKSKELRIIKKINKIESALDEINLAINQNPIT